MSLISIDAQRSKTQLNVGNRMKKPWTRISSILFLHSKYLKVGGCGNFKIKCCEASKAAAFEKDF